MTPEVVTFLRDYGLPISMFVTAIGAGARGVWVWGRELKAAEGRCERAERRADKWQDIALHALGSAEKIADKVS